MRGACSILLSRSRAMGALLAVAGLLVLSLTAAFGAAPRGPALAEATAPLDRQFFIGTWETRNYEHGRDVRILWLLRPDGTLDYEFQVDGIWSRGSSGTWEFRDGVMHEEWHRAEGRRDRGRGSVEKLDENTIKLTIIDNGNPEYTGLMRVYRRLGPPQIVDGAGALPPG